MATVKIPLNKLQRVTVSLSATPIQFYTAPTSRASIILLALGSNITEVPQTVTLSISTDAPNSQYDILKNVTIGSYDAANLLIGKVVLVEGDKFIASCSNDGGINLTLSILETINID
jgi:hypothetical protein